LPATLPNAQMWRFENGVELVGYAYNNRRFEPDDVLTVDLYWASLSPAVATDRIWLQLVDGSGRMLAFAEATFADLLPAEAGMITLAMIVPPDLPPGSYHMELYVRDHVTNGPHSLVAEDGRLINNNVGLAPVYVFSDR
jgi:hypothetical protein